MDTKDRTIWEALRRWAVEHRRPLGIRDATDPWAILVAEVMSQQTRIDRVEPPWRSFLARWPRPGSLAVARTADLLDAWAGLGYNRRALALREAARAIVERHDGSVPADIAALESLPGVGPYTARAVAASAFAVPVAPLDVNVRRVLGRVAGAATSVRALQAFADERVWSDDAKAWVEAVMDLAVHVCTARGPKCEECPLARGCRSAAAFSEQGLPEQRDAIPRAAPTPVRRSARPDRVAFPTTRRWLRGELLRRARALERGAWLPLDEGVGSHDVHAVREAAAALVAESFLEAHPGSRHHVRVAES